LVYLERCVRLYMISSPQRSWNPFSTFHDDNFCKFHLLYVCRGDACALETRRRFVTERGEKKKKKPKFKPRPHCLGNQRAYFLRTSLKHISVIWNEAGLDCRGGHTVDNSLLRRMLFALGKTWLTVLALPITSLALRTDNEGLQIEIAILRRWRFFFVLLFEQRKGNKQAKQRLILNKK